MSDVRFFNLTTKCHVANNFMTQTRLITTTVITTVALFTWYLLSTNQAAASTDVALHSSIAATSASQYKKKT